MRKHSICLARNSAKVLFKGGSIGRVVNGAPLAALSATHTPVRSVWQSSFFSKKKASAETDHVPSEWKKDEGTESPPVQAAVETKSYPVETPTPVVKVPTEASERVPTPPRIETKVTDTPLQQFVSSKDEQKSTPVSNEQGEPSPVKAAEEWKKPKIQEEIEEELRQLKDSILKPLDASFSFVSETTYSIPMVLLIGNHSSGKSTLINFLCGRNIQDTGVAPTDDGFTIIQRGAFDMDDDGPSSVGNLAYQFKALKSFGYTFINRFKVKTRVLPPNTNIPFNMMVVDSPGMIDTPIHVTDRTSADGQMRGYDFLAATRWFALRSDVILLMFDPANPGTTGETLDVLTRSLAGCEHKFLLVLNKVDVFEKVEDFARAYGSLCWNLSKVIKLKDMPRIFITCTPLEKGETAGKATPASIIPEEETRRQRNLILQELLAAPLRRLDNLIAETEESVENLIMSLEVCNQLRYQLFERQTMMLVTFVVSAVTVPALIYAVSTLSMSATILLSTLSVAGFYLMALLGQSNLKAFNQRLIAESDNTVHSLYGKNYTNEMHLRWINVVRPRLTKVASSRTMDGSCDIHELPKTSKRSIRQLKSLLTNDLPVLREKIVEHKRLLYKAQSNQSS